MPHIRTARTYLAIVDIFTFLYLLFICGRQSDTFAHRTRTGVFRPGVLLLLVDAQSRIKILIGRLCLRQFFRCEMMRWLPIIILFELGRFSGAQRCGNPIFFDNAEKQSTKEWKINGEGSLNIVRSDTNFYAYEYKGRTKDADIVSRELNAGCFVEGVPYAITARFKLVNKRGKGYSCFKTSKVLGHGLTSPVFFLDLTLPNGAQKRMQLFNEHTLHSSWKSKTFNEHISRFTGTKDLASATKIILSISGYDSDSTLTFDDVKIDFDCETLFHNSYAEVCTARTA